jgi:type IX secretion system PorP/SprF family membrane protein
MRKMKRLALICISTIASFFLHAQQLPDYSGYPSNLFQLNPAYTGTKGTLDARAFYRKQWTGFENAPVTKNVAIHSRLWKGRIGVGGTFYNDQTGPTQRIDYSIMAAAHIRFPDVELSAGVGMHFNKYTVNGSMLTTHWVGDPSVNTNLTDFDKTKNVSAGVLLYNDRFHFGLGASMLADKTAEFYLDDPSKASGVNFKPHYYFTTGYNFHGHPDYVWENNLMINYVEGLPMVIYYNLRVHFREKFMGGIGFRLRDALVAQVGYIIFERVQVIYSYDLGVSRLRKGHNGTHEFILGYRFDYYKRKGGYKNHEKFQKQRYNIF